MATSRINELVDQFDWASTSLGPKADWPSALKTVVQIMLDSSNVMSLVWGPEATHIYNDAFAEALLPPQWKSTALGQSAYTTFAAHQTSFSAEIAEGMAGISRQVHGKRYPVLRDGVVQDAWFNVTFAPIRDATAEVGGVLWTLFEITHQWLAEEAMRESEERLAAAFASVPVGIAVFDANGQAVLNNAEFQRFLPSGVMPSRDTERGRYWQAWDAGGRIIPPRNWPSARALRGEPVIPGLEMLYTDEDGRSFWTNVASAPIRDGTGQVTGCVSVINDITERRKAESGLRESEERLRMALEAGQMGTWRFDLTTGRQEWSEQQFELYGLTPSETPPSRDLFLSLVHPKDLHLIEFGPEDLRPDRGLLDAEFRIVRPDGEVRWLVSHTVVRRNDADDPIEMIGLNWDITDRKLAEAKLRDSEGELKVLVAELQHRTRNLIGIVRALSDRTAQGSPDLPTFLARYKARLGALGRAQALLSGLKTHNRVTFEQLLRTELDAIGEDGRISTNGPTGTRLRTASVQMLALAIHELSTNSVKYGALSQPDGHLDISWSLEEDATRLKVVWRETGVSLPAGNETRRRGGGRELIETALPYQLHARTTFELTPAGLLCTLDLPVSQHEEPADD